MARRIRAKGLRARRNAKGKMLKTSEKKLATNFVSRQKAKGKSIPNNPKDYVAYYRANVRKPKVKENVSKAISEAKKASEFAKLHGKTIKEVINDAGLLDNKLVKAMSPVRQRELALKLKAIDSVRNGDQAKKFIKPGQANSGKELINGQQGEAYINQHILKGKGEHLLGMSPSKDLKLGDRFVEVKRNSGFEKNGNRYYFFELQERNRLGGWSDSMIVSMRKDPTRILFQIGPKGEVYGMNGAQASKLYNYRAASSKDGYNTYHTQGRDKPPTTRGFSFNQHQIQRYGGVEMAKPSDMNELKLKTSIHPEWELPEWYKG